MGKGFGNRGDRHEGDTVFPKCGCIAHLIDRGCSESHHQHFAVMQKLKSFV